MMDKTIKINIAGTLFQIDEVAYRILRDWLQSINNRFRNVPGGHETIEDIESRIAEIFQSQQGLAGVITKENIEGMISIIGKPEDFDHNDTETYSQPYIAQRKRMYRNPDDSIISGVCGGIGAYLNTDPVLFRILFVIFTSFYGVGFFIYLGLWIALPSAKTETQKKEMYGNSNYSSNSKNIQPDGTYTTSSPSYKKIYYTTSKFGDAINEVFRAIGRVCYIALRIFLIIIGSVLVLAGFVVILSLVVIFIFKYPGGFSTDVLRINLNYLPDFLNYIVNPSAVPWIIGLSVVALVLPMIALIYGGIKMIFWFRAKDGVFSLTALVLWVMTITALTMILLNEGISFAETGKLSSQNILPTPPDTLYLIAGKKVSDLKFDKELTLEDEGYTVFINDGKKELYIRPHLNISNSEEDVAKVEVRKRSSGRSEPDAMKKVEELLYNYSINGDTLLLDEYFTIPAGRKWAADNVHINIKIPEGTYLKSDRALENLFYNRKNEFEEGTGSSALKTESGLWILTDEGLKAIDKTSVKNK